MKRAVLCLLLLSACEIEAARNFRVYELTWTCLSLEGCERAEEMMLIDRAEVSDEGQWVRLSLTRDGFYSDYAQMVSSEELPAGCYSLHGVSFFGIEADLSRICRTSGRIELDLSIPNQDPTTRSKWLVEGREID